MMFNCSNVTLIQQQYYQFYVGLKINKENCAKAILAGKPLILEALEEQYSWADHRKENICFVSSCKHIEVN